VDFFQIQTKESKGGIIEVFPDFIVGRSKDLMVRGRSFYAIWDEQAGLWSTDEYDVQRLVDAELQAAAEVLKRNGHHCTVKYLSSFGSKSWTQFKIFLSNLSDNSHQLDQELTFANSEVVKNDYVSRRLPYPLESGEIRAWDELVGTLYSPDERAKIEWAIGAVVSGDAKKIQKFIVLYGPAGTGKSTILDIIQRMFPGYTTTFEAKALGSNGNAFSTEVFKSNPLVAIQHDGDLSKIDDNTKLNSIISHEEMTMNEKYKPSYSSRVNAFLFMGTNQPVRISDAKSGIIRRLIDVHPTGVRLPINHYHTLMQQIDFELGPIAYHCLQVYRDMGKNYYNAYRPTEMMLQTDVFYNFIEANYDVFKTQDGVSLKQAYALYKEYCTDTGIERMLPQYKVREELRNYFDEFKDRAEVKGETVRSYYSGFTAQPFRQEKKNGVITYSLVMDETTSLFNLEYADCPAQGATSRETPKKRWADVTTTLADIDPRELHFVRVPENHVVIDFDLLAEDGSKSLERNLEAASQWPATYAEISKSGAGIHLHYLYDGDATTLARSYSDGIEIKVFTGDASLRRKLTKCNSVPIATIKTGLPIKEKKVLPSNTIKSEKGLRDLIARNLRKEIHPGTKPSIDFIHKILEEAYESGMAYDVTDLRPKLLTFANNSTNQPLVCLKVVQKMKFKSDDICLGDGTTAPGWTEEDVDDPRKTYFDVEVYPNLFVVCWKFQGGDEVIRMINPSPQEVEQLFRLKLVGYNCRRYDNHILYARYMGYDNQGLYELSQKIINGSVGAMFGEAYNLSYADIYDFSSKRQTLKKFGIELGMHHIELDIPWDEPVPEELWDKVVEYCVNDVLITEAVDEDRAADFTARQILAELSGLSVNDTTQKHTAKIIFGNEKNPQRSFVYTELSKEFPGYEFDRGVSTYRGETTGEGGYVHSDPGMYDNVALLDVASMHPTSIEQLRLFGDYTANFSALKDARMAIKRGSYEVAREMMGGRLAPYLDNEDNAEALAYALKIVINTVYGLTSAKFDNPFRDHRNIDNIVAKRGALFMIDLKHAVQEKGFTVAHIKTDSIKIPDATQEIIDFVTVFGQKYGYDFEHEATYDKFVLVNDAVYVARKGNDFIAVGAQFQHPFVYKTLFTKEAIGFDDLCETKEVKQGVMYLGERHIGRIGRFIPVIKDGAALMRVKDDKSYAVTGTKGYLWIEASMAMEMGMDMRNVDYSYFDRLVEEARNDIDHFGPFTEFVGAA
jgi:energy-coupling factor transporter ATP-binding protein EcfA2